MTVEFDNEFATTADHARLYRRLGIQVVPALSPQEGAQWKRPAIPWRELEHQIVDESTFEKWYGARGDHTRRPNLGMVAGEASGRLFIVDLDVYKDPQALNWWQGLMAIHNNNSELETVTQRTGGGGFRDIRFTGNVFNQFCFIQFVLPEDVLKRQSR